jgi:hypothetical protein
LLRQPEAAHGLGDFDHQAGFDLQLVGVGQAQVGEHIARAGLDLDALNDSLCHAASP